jgi:hypothetical protein
VIGTKDRSYIIWDGFEVYTPGAKGIVVNSSSFVTITKCEVHGQRTTGGGNADGIRIDNSDDCTFSDNYLYDIDDGDSPRGCGATGLKMYGSKRNIIEYNEATDVGCGLRNKVDGQGNTFRYNWVHDCTSAGIHLGVGEGTSNHTVYNNVITRCATGVSVRGTSFTHSGTSVYHNTIVDINREGISVHGASTTDITVQSNILYDCRNSDINSSNNRLSYCGENCFYLTTAGCGISGDPDLVDPALNSPTDAQLQAGSICENAATDGNDIGAYATGNESIGRTWS